MLGTCSRSGKSKEQKRGFLPSCSNFLAGRRGVTKYILEAINTVTKIGRWIGRQGGYWMIQKDLVRKVTFRFPDGEKASHD